MPPKNLNHGFQQQKARSIFPKPPSFQQHIRRIKRLYNVKRKERNSQIENNKSIRLCGWS